MLDIARAWYRGIHARDIMLAVYYRTPNVLDEPSCIRIPPGREFVMIASEHVVELLDVPTEAGGFADAYIVPVEYPGGNGVSDFGYVFSSRPVVAEDPTRDF